MQPLDRDNEQFREDAMTMRKATLEQRRENGEQQTRMRVTKEKHDALRERMLPGEAHAEPAPWTSA